MVSITVWCLAATGPFLPLSPEVQAVLRWATFVGILGSSTALWCLCRAITDPLWRPIRTTLWLAVPPLLVLAAAAANPHQLMFVDVLTPRPGTAARLTWTFGPAFAVYAVYGYGINVWGLVLLVRARRRASWYFRRQLDTLLLSALVPVVSSAVHVAAPSALGGVEYTPLAFVVTGLLDAWALFRLGLGVVVPIAREQVLENVADAIAVIDTAGTIVDLNAEGRRLQALLRPDLPADMIGRPASDLLAPSLLAPLDPRGEFRTTTTLAPGFHVDARTTSLVDAAGRELGRVVVLRDTSTIVEQRIALQEANAALQDQLALNERLRAQLAEEVLRDPLTGLHNRRALEPALERAALAASVDDHGGAALVIVDVDHFKAVNDTYGHPTGDRVLQAVARALVTATRADDAVIRFGGEEFVVVLGHCPAAAAWARAEELRERCAQLQVPVDPADRTGAVIRLTVSAGVAHAGIAAGAARDLDPAALLDAADAALYAAKTSGRDRVVCAPNAPDLEEAPGRSPADAPATLSAQA